LPTLIEEAVRQLTKAVAEGTQAGAASVPVPGLLLYTSVLSGPSGSCVAVSLQRLRMRDAVTSAAARYDLTVRECNVLDLILHGYETREIAQRLNIAESTVGEYVKHLHIKMRAKHRSEMLARVFEWPELSFET
jgi:DNA-binding NarL/FixJ family response regulator